MGTLKNLNEGYGPNYMGALAWNPVYDICFYESDAPKQRLLTTFIYEWVEYNYYDMFMRL